jgi:hypothetical protein
LHSNCVCDFKKIRSLAQRQTAGENKSECSRATRDGWSQMPCTPLLTAISVSSNPIPLNSATAGQSALKNSGGFSSLTPILINVERGTVVQLSFRQSGRERQTLISYYQPGGFAL